MLPTIRLGSLGEAVKMLQAALNLWREPDQTRLAEDGVFGRRRTARVRGFQAGNALCPECVGGRLTWEALTPLVEEVTGATPAGHESPRIVITDPAETRAPLSARSTLRVSRAWTATP